MTREMDTVLDSWAAEWQSSGDQATPTMAAVRRQSRRHVWAGILNILIGVGFLVIYSAWTLADPDPAMIVAAIAVWIFVLAGVGFDLWNRRGTWQITDLPTLEFTDLARAQLESRLRGLRFGWGLLAAEIAFFIPWIAWIVSEEASPTAADYLQPYAFLTVMAIGFGAALLWLQRRARRQLEGLVALERSLGLE